MAPVEKSARCAPAWKSGVPLTATATRLSNSVHVEELPTGMRPGRRGSPGGGELPAGAVGSGEGADVDLLPPRFERDVGDPVPIGRERRHILVERSGGDGDASRVTRELPGVDIAKAGAHPGAIHQPAAIARPHGLIHLRRVTGEDPLRLAAAVARI